MEFQGMKELKEAREAYLLKLEERGIPLSSLERIPSPLASWKGEGGNLEGKEAYKKARNKLHSYYSERIPSRKECKQARKEARGEGKGKAFLNCIQESFKNRKEREREERERIQGKKEREFISISLKKEGEAFLQEFKEASLPFNARKACKEGREFLQKMKERKERREARKEGRERIQASLSPSFFLLKKGIQA